MRIHGLVAVLLVSWITGCSDPTQSADPGPGAAHAFVVEYVDALNAGDPRRLAGVLHMTASSREVADRLKLYGARQFRDVAVSISSEFPRIYNVTIDVQNADGEIIEMRVVVEWSHGTYWHMAPLLAPSPS